MKFIILILSASLSVGCPAIPKELPCTAIQLLPDTSECHPVNGGGVECSMGDLPPFSWGNCLEDKDHKFTCLKNGLLSKYSDLGMVTAKRKSGTCKVLDEQFKAAPSGERIFPPHQQVPKKDKQI